MENNQIKKKKRNKKMSKSVKNERTLSFFSSSLLHFILIYLCCLFSFSILSFFWRFSPKPNNSNRKLCEREREEADESIEFICYEKGVKSIRSISHSSMICYLFDSFHIVCVASINVNLLMRVIQHKSSASLVGTVWRADFTSPNWRSNMFKMC